MPIMWLAIGFQFSRPSSNAAASFQHSALGKPRDTKTCSALASLGVFASPWVANPARGGYFAGHERVRFTKAARTQREPLRALSCPLLPWHGNRRTGNPLAFIPILVLFPWMSSGVGGTAREVVRGTDVFLPTKGNRRVRRHTRQKHVGGARERTVRAIPPT